MPNGDSNNSNDVIEILSDLIDVPDVTINLKLQRNLIYLWKKKTLIISQQCCSMKENVNKLRLNVTLNEC